jgi:hypothetical protein
MRRHAVAGKVKLEIRPHIPSIRLQPKSFVFKLSLATVASTARTLKIFRIEEEGLIALVVCDVLLGTNLVINICRR